MDNILELISRIIKPEQRQLVSPAVDRPQIRPDQQRLINKAIENYGSGKQQAPVVETVSQPTTSDFSGFTTAPVPQEYSQTILEASKRYGVRPQVLASLLFSESGFNPKAINANDPSSIDRGIAQINTKAYPNISDEQAYDPNFAIDFAARTLSENQKHFGDINRAIAAYNVGQGGANVKGPTVSGLGPKGQAYLDKIAKGLSPELRRELGIKLSE